MEGLGEFFVAGLVAGLLTLIELDRTFYVPEHTKGKIRLWAWWWGFIVANGLLAAAIDLAVRDSDQLRGVSWVVRGLGLGAAYLAVVRLKFATFQYPGNAEVAFGPEAAYEAAKAFVFKKINMIAMAARTAETIQLSRSNTLGELAELARGHINHDALMDETQKRDAKAWLLAVIEDAKRTTSDEEHREAIADFILSGERRLPYDVRPSRSPPGGPP
jgi:hypothetical protein